MEKIFEYKDCIRPVQAVKSINVYGVDKVSDKKPTYTIAIPTYNRTETLVETIESALAQIGSDDYHIIVVDNNPERNDETELFMVRYKDDSRVSYYKNTENVGMAGNWNKCLLLSPSNKVVLLHDDDVMSPFCIEAFNKITPYLKNDWAMVKPNAVTFNDINNVKFVKPHQCQFSKLKSYHFIDSCPIGAPTAILLNKQVLVNLGGYNQDYYPSFDYAMSAKVSLTNSLYIAWFDSPIGGYRIGLNESLSQKTMDLYFIMRYKIADAYCSQIHIPKLISKFIHSILNEKSVKKITSDYKMANYEFKCDDFDFLRFPKIINNMLASLYLNVLRIIGYLRRNRFNV